MNPFESRIDLTPVTTTLDAIRAEISKVIVGQHQTIDLLLTALLADGHVLIEGVPGVAKTLTAKLLAKTLSVQFGRIQFTPDLMPSDVLGTSVFTPKTGDFTFRQGPIFSNLILIDEINRAPAKTQAALFEVMEERQVTNDGTTYRLDEPFMVLATQNPIEQEGTYRLPEAQLDRFLFKIVISYPSASDETAILRGHHQRQSSGRHTVAEAVDLVQSVVSAEQLAELRARVAQVHVEDKLFDYIAQLVQATRTGKAIYLGASPRASIALLNSAKALATLRSRDFITPEDVQELAVPVLRHRILLTPEREMEGGTPDDVIGQLIQSVEVPR